MKIENSYSINEIKNYSKVVSNGKLNIEPKNIDSIEISNQAKTIKQYMSEPLPIDTKRVQDIKDRIANGTYSIDSKAIAQGIIKAMN